MNVRCITRVLPALLLAGGVLIFAGCRHPPRPLDPLTADEKKDAERIARADSRVIQALGGGKTELAYVTFFALKPTNAPAVKNPDLLVLERAAEIVFYRFNGNVGVRVVVSLARKSVTEVQAIEGSAVPVTPQEWTDAVQLALRDPQIQQLLGNDLARFRTLTRRQSNSATLRQNAVRSMLLVAPKPNDPCSGNRCVELYFRRGSAYLIDTAVVNLSSGTVRIEKGTVPPRRTP